ncbi:hypothetical protein [Cellulomonas sp. NPDC058312]|uniref:hypothetical protein n=1 Tax=Cellulomonas sp. NPDC058312 TaxID=3346441 RepID=UPI0036EB4E40
MTSSSSIGGSPRLERPSTDLGAAEEIEHADLQTVLDDGPESWTALQHSPENPNESVIGFHPGATAVTFGPARREERGTKGLPDTPYESAMRHHLVTR